MHVYVINFAEKKMYISSQNKGSSWSWSYGRCTRYNIMW